MNFGDDFELMTKVLEKARQLGADRDFWEFLLDDEDTFREIIRDVSGVSGPRLSGTGCFVEPKDHPDRKELLLIHFGYQVTEAQVRMELERRNLKPAGPAELKTVASNAPQLQHSFPIVAIAEARWVRNFPAGLYPQLDESGSSSFRDADVTYWKSNYRFLVYEK
jgi:hypothetical protein